MNLPPWIQRASCCLVLAFGGLAWAVGEDRERVDFARDVRPILEARCFECHGVDKAKAGLRLDARELAFAGSYGGETKVIVPGDAAKSLLVQRLVTTNEDERMPAGGAPLSPAQIDTLRRWIDAGAAWPDDGTAIVEGANAHWAYVAPREPGVPVLRDASGVRSPIDAFVRARLEAEGVAPAPEADRATLLRRIHLDLTGIPPTLEELDAFLADADDRAYERRVDALLASPRHAERMAQWWLDLARYADTNGYEKDERRTMWRWRDWVIDAFDRDLPFDQFTIEQLAGDLLPDATLEQRIATGFHRNTLVNQEGGTDPEEFRVAAVVDRVNTTSTVWLGTTMACAQCHNHKYDPLSQREYYEMLAFFDSTSDAGDKLEPMVAAPTHEQARREHELDTRVAALAARLSGPDAAMDAREATWTSILRATLPKPARWSAWTPLAARSSRAAPLEILADGSVIDRGAARDTDRFALVVEPGEGVITAVRIDALLDASLPTEGPGRALNGNFVLSDVVLTVANGERARFAGAEADFAQGYGGDFHPENVIDANASSGWAIDRQQYDTRAQSLVLALEHAVRVRDGERLVLELACESPFAAHTLGRFRVSATDDEGVRAWIAPPAMAPWQVVGPFTGASQAELVSTRHPPRDEIESGVPLSPRYEPDLRWLPRPEWVDGATHALEGTNSKWFLSRTVAVESPQPLVLSLGADDALRAWVNGALVLESASMRGALGRQHEVEIALAAGSNRISLEIVNGAGPGGFFFQASRATRDRMGMDVVDALRADAPTDEQRARVSDYYRRTQDEAGRALATELDAARAELAQLRSEIPKALVLEELATPRTTHVHVKGNHRSQGDVVTPDVPHVLPPLAGDGPRNRLALARWIVSPENPLTSRVIVNRVWELLFARGLVATSDDFGTRGDVPSHPELLDWLALDFVRSGWSLDGLVRRIVTSATYRQSSRAGASAHERDPLNVLLARAPRPRLEIETLRDASLAIGGLLIEKRGGPSVMPPQPDGVWAPVYSEDRWSTAEGGERFRRGLYTFWRRSSPYATFVAFDAPSRELSCTRRPATNTPLQALALLNDPAFVECAIGLARRMQRASGDDEAKIAFGFRACTARAPRADEIEVLARLLTSERERFESDASAAKTLLEHGKHALGVDATPDAGELAAWTAVANVLLNLDETLTRS